jgi:hypothetical protein
MGLKQLHDGPKIIAGMIFAYSNKHANPHGSKISMGPKELQYHLGAKIIKNPLRKLFTDL